MARPAFSIQPLESRRLLSANTVQDFAHALGTPTQLIEGHTTQAEPGLRANHSLIDQQMAELRAALAELARLQGR